MRRSVGKAGNHIARHLMQIQAAMHYDPFVKRGHIQMAVFSCNLFFVIFAHTRKTSREIVERFCKRLGIGNIYRKGSDMREGITN